MGIVIYKHLDWKVRLNKVWNISNWLGIKLHWMPFWLNFYKRKLSVIASKHYNLTKSHLHQMIKETRVKIFGKSISSVEGLFDIKCDVNALALTSPFRLKFAWSQFVWQLFWRDAEQESREVQVYKIRKKKLLLFYYFLLFLLLIYVL